MRRCYQGTLDSHFPFTWHRFFARGRPYTPLGTVQDFTSSPHHVGLAEMQRELDQRCGRSPTGLYEGPTIMTPQGPRPLFQGDMRDDPTNDELPEHYIAAQQRMSVLQSDSYGESIRGVVAPPPPVGFDIPRAYRPPRVELGVLWWSVMAVIVLTFLLLLKYGQ
uniref:Uncharacterized protein n=1 Tax=Trypanosoma congolense (strain IL3000) TaxID=1068625 RepID=G0URI7_TRYCI|nr:conserved hypothetical protein [Trypanosoma congolense IL3000]